MLLTKNKPYLISMIVLAFISLVSATQLTLEKIELWKNPDYVPTCSWNPLFSCQGPMQSWQAGVFGIPNPIIGMVGFAFVVLIAFTAFFVQLPKWYWALYSLGVTFAYGFIVWLITQALYDIEALCVYCMIVWVCVIPMFWLTWAEFFKAHYPNNKASFYFNRLKWPIIILNYVIVIVMIYVQFTGPLNFLIKSLF